MTRRHGQLKFYYGPMDCGKSTLALQINHNLTRRQSRGMLVTRGDRAGAATISSRLGLSSAAYEVSEQTDFSVLVGDRDLDYLVCDEAQFYSVPQVEQLADLADRRGIDVYAFGLLTDFQSLLFPGSRRLVELADDVVRLQVEVFCWCGRPGLLNVRVSGGRVVREGAQLLIGDTGDDDVHYRVLCRRHFRAGLLAAPETIQDGIRDDGAEVG